LVARDWNDWDQNLLLTVSGSVHWEKRKPFCCFLAQLMSQPIEPILLPPPQDAYQEGIWLQQGLHQWLDREFLPEPINQAIAERAAQIFVRQRLEGENDLGSLVMAIVTEMQGFDFSKSFYSEFAIANAVSDLLLASLGFEWCCGQV